MDKDAQKDFTDRMTEDEHFRYRKNWWISLNKRKKNGLMKDRSDINEALTKLHVFTKSLEKSNSRRFLSGTTSNSIHRFSHPVHLGGSGTIPGGVHDKKQESPQLSSCKEQHN